MKKRTFLTGALVLAIGGLITKMIGAFYRVPLSNVLGAEGIGLYQLIFPIYSFVLVFVSGGIASGEAKLIAEARSEGRSFRAMTIFRASFLLMSVAGLFFGTLMIVLSRQIAFIVGNGQSAIGFFAIGFAVLFSAMIAAIRGYFQGFERMAPTACSQVLEQVFKLLFGLVLSRKLLVYGVEYGVLGAILGVVIGEVGSLLFIFVFFVRRKKSSDLVSHGKTGFFVEMKKVLMTSIPIMTSALILPLSLAIDTFLVVNLLKKAGFSISEATALFGIQSGMVNSLTNFPSVISSALAISIIPSISYSIKKNDMFDVREKVSKSLKVVLLISLPCVAGIFILAPVFMELLYPALRSSGYLNVATILLRISAFSIFYLTILQVSAAVLQGAGKIYKPVENLLIATALKFVLTLILVSLPEINIFGVAIASVISYFLAAILNLFAVKNICNPQIRFRNVIIILAASILMALILALLKPLLILRTNLMVASIVCICVAIIVYFSIICITRVVTKKELSAFNFLKLRKKR